MAADTKYQNSVSIDQDLTSKDANEWTGNGNGKVLNGEEPAFHIRYKKQIIQGALLLTLIAMVYFFAKEW